MIHQSGAEPPRWQTWSWLLLLLAWITVLRLPTFTQVVTVWDESLYFMIARDWLKWDILPYTGLFDHKPLGIYVIFATAIAAFGDSIVSIRIISILAVALSSWGIYNLSDVLGFRRFGIIAAFLFPVMALGMDGVTSNTELFITPLTVWAMVGLSLALKHNSLHQARWICISGFLFGCALSTKYVVILEAMLAGAVLVAFGYVHKWSTKKTLSQCTLMIFFACLPTLACALYYQLNGQLVVFLEHNFLANARHIVNVDWPTYWDSLIGSTKVWVKWVLPVAFFGVTGFITHRNNPRQLVIGLLLCLWITVTVVQAWIIGKFYDHHYYLALAPVAVLFAWASAGLVEKPIKVAIPAMLVGCLYWGVPTVQQYYYPWLTHYLAEKSPYRQAGHYLQQQLEPDDTIYVINDQMILYYLAGVTPPTRYAYFHFIMDPHFSEVARIDPKTEIDRIFASQPKFVVASNPPEFMPTNPLINYALNKAFEDYSLVAQVGHLNIYRRDLSEKSVRKTANVSDQSTAATQQEPPL